MDSSEQRRKRKRGMSIVKLSSVSAKFVFLLVLFTLLIVLLNHGRILITPSSLESVSILASTNLSLLSSSSLIDSVDLYRIDDQVSFPDHVLLLVSSRVGKRLMIRKNDKVECVYGTSLCNGSDRVVSNVLSVDGYTDVGFIVRCPLPPMNYSKVVDLVWWGRSLSYCDGDERLWGKNLTVNFWQKVVYEVMLDGETAVVFAKGLNLRSNRESDPTPFSCHFGLGTWERDDRFVFTTKAIMAAQEVVRCMLPRSIRRSPEKAEGIRVTIGVTHDVHARAKKYELMPSVAKISNSKVIGENRKKYELCACTMVWNQASAIREWITYHAWLGVERWFIYDNNSDDGIKEATEELDREGYNVSRHMWPWIKTQEAGFSHCSLRAKDECNWVSFMDVDEFFYFPIPRHHQRRNGNLVFPVQNSLRHVVANFSSSTSIAEIRTSCHSFGPSGLKSPPKQGVTAGYTCRLQSPERHKSIVRPEALDDTLLTVIHHFHLKKGYTYLNLPQSVAVINHYKYQVWEIFKAKFYRRVATYVADWKDNQNEGSRDRAPGLGTEAIEPPDWHLRFCEVWDTGLRDFVLANMADPGNGLLPWQRS
ncbi:Glycosyltransferase family 92 protein [Heracleum sosnowskyi]|uniref:Glycosyltransferase family 92 protein n=1 Tax=Heracleum sosnowskyi TaxID=360622 RepID=A0AAD8MQ69_9APIA|nr:Glycosyltransferase family 92 protein [Heracleum sosnowskyi]